jgi:hypothetical protein
VLLSSNSKTHVSYNPASFIQCDVFSHDILLLGQGQIKTGAPCRSERLAKYNQVSILLTIGFCSYVNNIPYFYLELEMFWLWIVFKFLFSCTCSCCVLKRSLAQKQSMLEQISGRPLNRIRSW